MVMFPLANRSPAGRSLAGLRWCLTAIVKQGDPAAITEMDLRYQYFGVKFELTVDGVKIVSKARFVTLVDLALSLSVVVERISSGQDAAFGFTERGEVIRLSRDGDLVAVSSSIRPVRASVERGELVGEFVQFL
ncbi:hypothetical protein [Streptomyces sp. NPDC002779]|uniref:hypothetical protein n=1 Tax=Streptomyces sp. NPDC002779 TaxID=3364664 RepID=UPI0036CE9421